MAVESGDDVGVTWRTLTSADRTATCMLTSGVCEIVPGGVLDLHRDAPLELYYFLEGTGIVTLGESERGVGPGTAIWISGNTPHGIRNDSASLLKRLYGFPVDAFSNVEYEVR